LCGPPGTGKVRIVNNNPSLRFLFDHCVNHSCSVVHTRILTHFVLCLHTFRS
jgi:hypothetical protein